MLEFTWMHHQFMEKAIIHFINCFFSSSFKVWIFVSSKILEIIFMEKNCARFLSGFVQNQKSSEKQLYRFKSDEVDFLCMQIV